MLQSQFLAASLIDSKLETNAPDAWAPWWSFTKTILATTTLKLIENGHFALDDLYPEKPFTIRQLLQHTAGVTDYGGLKNYHAAVEAAEDPWPRAKLLTEANADQLIYEPGQSWRYSNIGYLYIRQLIETTLDSSLQDAFAQLIFEPLGLSDLFVAQTRDDLDRFVWGNQRRYHPDWVYHGLIVGTPPMAVRLLAAIASGKIINHASLQEMQIPHSVGRPIRHWVEPSCGLGLMMDPKSEFGLMYGHTGGGPGSGCAVYHFPELPGRPTFGVFAADQNDLILETDVLRLARQIANNR